LRNIRAPRKKGFVALLFKRFAPAFPCCFHASSSPFLALGWGKSYNDKLGCDLQVFFEKFFLPLCSGAVLLLMFTNPMHWGWTSRIIGIIVALALAGLAALLIHHANKAQKSATPANAVNVLAAISQPIATPITISQPVVIRRKEGRIYIPEEVTLFSLQKRFDDPNLTIVQAERSIQPYLGKWVRYTGSIDNVTARGIFFQSTPVTGRVRAYFADEWHEHLPILPRGKTVTVDGKLEYVDYNGAKLEECEFIDGSER
jgi:hypothetical protein